jgi:hypothetical protein
MSSVCTATYKPSWALGGEGRLLIADPPRDYPSAQDAGALPTDWDEVARVVQRALERLAARVRRRRTDIRSRPGRTAATAFPLFAYYTFDVPTNPELEPVVVGVLFARAGQDRIAVRGDVSGEESGSVHYEAEATEVRDEHAAVLTQAYQVASDLAERADAVEKCLPRLGSGPPV